MRVIHRWASWCFLAVATLGCAGTQFGAQVGDGGWLRIETDHFLIHSAQGRIAAMEMARSLEEIRASLLKLGWGNASDPKGRTEVVVFDRKSEYSKFQGSSQSDGVAVTRVGQERLLGFYPGRGNGIPVIAVHELTHDLSRWFLPLQPLWYSEGVATYFETLKFDRDTNTATVGDLNDGRISVLKSEGFTMRVEKLFNAASSIRENPRESQSVYSGIWLLTHFLRNEHAERFRGFRVDMASLMPWRDAWAKHFGNIEMDALNEQVIEYAKRASFTKFSATIELPAFDPKVTNLSKTEAHGLMLWTAHRFGNSKLYDKLLLSAPPGIDNDVNALKARVYRSRDRDEQKVLTAHVTEQFSDNGEVWLMRAQALGPYSEGPAALLQAQKLIPDHPGVRSLMVHRELKAGHAEAALAHAQLLIRRAPPMPETYGGFIEAMAANGGCELVETVMESIDSVLGDCTWTDDDTGKKSTCHQYLGTVKQRACQAQEGS